MDPPKIHPDALKKKKSQEICQESLLNPLNNPPVNYFRGI